MNDEQISGGNGGTSQSSIGYQAPVSEKAKPDFNSPKWAREHLQGLDDEAAKKNAALDRLAKAAVEDTKLIDRLGGEPMLRWHFRDAIRTIEAKAQENMISRGKATENAMKAALVGAALGAFTIIWIVVKAA